MSHDRKRDELEGLSSAEREELGALADRLRATRPGPPEPQFFEALQQRIAAEVAVTPRPRRREGWLARLLARPAQRWALAATAVAATVAAVLLLGTPSSRTPVHVLPAPDQLSSIREPSTTDQVAQAETPARAITIPDELWSAGFLSHRDPLDDEAVADWLDEPATATESEPMPDAMDGADWAGWALEDLTDAELLELEALLGG